MVGIGFFAPLPLALMMPFMAGQSMLMGDAFGKAYQYGKRKISAMSNEEFNKLTTKQLGEEIVTDYTDIIPSLAKAVKASTEFQSLIIQELAKIIPQLPKDIVTGIGEGIDQIISPNATQTDAQKKSLLAGTSINHPFVMQFLPFGNISALNKIADVATSQPLLTQTTVEEFEASTEGVGKVTQLDKANRLAQEARDKRNAEALRVRLIDAEAKKKELDKQRARQTVVASTRKASQSQIAERTRLIQKIASQTQDIRDYMQRGNKTSSGMIALRQRIQATQLQLENLLRRYRF